MHKYAYVRTYQLRVNPSLVAFDHVFVEAEDTLEAYNAGSQEPKLYGNDEWDEINDYAFEVPNDKTETDDKNEGLGGGTCDYREARTPYPNDGPTAQLGTATSLVETHIRGEETTPLGD